MDVLISGGFSGPYEQLVPQFERATGIPVKTGSGSSQGSGPQTIAAQLARGVAADVVILSREGLTELIRAGRIAAGTDADLARTPIGAAVRAGAPKPDVATVETFKQAVLKARTVAVPSSTSGIFLMEEVFPRLGIADRVNVKATPRGTGAAALVAAGEADLGLLPVSEIMHADGVDLVGTIAEEIQLHQIFAAAAVAGSKHVDAAKRLIAFLTSSSAAATIRRFGMEPLDDRPQVALFDGVALDALRRDCPSAAIRSFDHGGVIYAQGSRCGDVYCVLRGQVKLARVSRDGEEFTTGLRTAGELFGAALNGSGPGDAPDTATAKGSVSAWCAPLAEFRNLVLRQPALGLRVVEALAQRQRQMERRLEGFAFKRTEARLVETLRELSGGFEARCEHGFGQHIRLTQQELADLVGASRPVTSTILNRLRDKGVLGYSREYLCVRDIDAVEQMIEE